MVSLMPQNLIIIYCSIFGPSLCTNNFNFEPPSYLYDIIIDNLKWTVYYFRFLKMICVMTLLVYKLTSDPHILTRYNTH